MSKRTMPRPLFDNHYNKLDICNYAMGLCGESGEVTDLIKKQVFHDHQPDVEGVKKEMGDVLHYLAGLATMYGLTLDEVATANIDKLMKRYPNGFSSERSVNRVE
ncbi:nucleoside triphosphate pyrophosphohydrolase family protein [Niallia sp. 03190]|uniref:nucleoside triphosphate pyrophosphohydrolase family protein n=1 Tax=Niallia sp. 03190 TaxID=3458061 RepID=UPI00404453E0